MKYLPDPFNLFGYGTNARSVPATEISLSSSHAETERVSYTVPVDKKALLVAASLGFSRTLAPTAAGFMQNLLYYRRAGGSENLIGGFSIQLEAVGDSGNISPNLFMPLFPKDRIRVTTQDASTGGLCGYTCALTIIEFDAHSVNGR